MTYYLYNRLRETTRYALKKYDANVEYKVETSDNVKQGLIGGRVFIVFPPF